MAIEQMFTSLPTTTNATMSDIICAVQGYVSPSNLGLSVQETLGQVFSLFSSSMVLFNAGNPNGAVAGTQYQTLCWDSSNNILYICTTSGTASTAVWTKVITLTAGTGISISQSGNNIAISATGGGMTWNNVTGTSATLAVNNGYVSANAGTVTFTLPSTANIGDTIKVVGGNVGGWLIAQNAGQKIIVGNLASTVGVGGSLASTNANDVVEFVCTVNNTTFTVTSGVGNYTVV